MGDSLGEHWEPCPLMESDETSSFHSTSSFSSESSSKGLLFNKKRKSSSKIVKSRDPILKAGTLEMYKTSWRHAEVELASSKITITRKSKTFSFSLDEGFNVFRAVKKNNIMQPHGFGIKVNTGEQLIFRAQSKNEKSEWMDTFMALRASISEKSSIDSKGETHSSGQSQLSEIKALQSKNNDLLDQIAQLKGIAASLQDQAADYEKRCALLARENKNLNGQDLDILTDEDLLSLRHCLKRSIRKVNLERAKRDIYRCIICMENQRETCLMPCGHAQFCNQCASNNLKRCPICNADVKGFQKIFL